ncbi:GntR family transcriptional regulator [Ornithinibacillus salinisoli]|uniref:GntR family transcriptional regulator n=1 Tax=Ornithinibacillus salinisoli TaxID=1848459 RepID=A0ABW4W1G4_9BACI
MESKLGIFDQTIDNGSGVPLHLQVRDILRKELLERKLVDESGKIATEHELMKRFGVSRVTIRTALKLLVEEGIIVRERGRGTFLRTNHPENWSGRLKGFTEIIKESGFQPGAKILEKGFITNSDENSIYTDKLHTDHAWQLKRLRYADEHPAAIEHAYYPEEYAANLQDQDLKSIAIYKHFEEELNVYLKEAKQVISAVNADADTAKLLQVKEGEALLYIERITYSSNSEPIEFLKAIYLPVYFQYLIKLSRSGI